MKYFKRLKIYKDYSGNCTFNPETNEAFSYRWWRFVAVVEGRLVFNDYRYSVTTAKHQRKVGAVLASLGIKPDITMPLPRGIRHDQTLAELIQEAEENVCNAYLEKILRRQDSYYRRKERLAAQPQILTLVEVGRE